MEKLPAHLKRYIFEQHYEKYTPVDQSVWRFILRQLKAFLSQHAHSSYLEGLEQTGIGSERIPRIEEISEKLAEFGWRALPVSGFIPPAAFMELQSLSILPIASDLRTLEHLLYTPAPDIVHEAAGHAPILADPQYASYLKNYAQVARKAIISREDLEVYEAIRHLSDIKENPGSTPAEIQKAQENLDRVTKSISHISEAAQLSRMNWWTAEYGLIGSLENPRIYGAGLLSSVGEARWCLSDRVKKIPLSVDCIEYGYDITEPQPQLFVTPDFPTLSKVLDHLAEKMAFRKGGLEGLRKAQQAKTINSVQWNSGLQVGGELTEILLNQNEVCYLRFQGPCQLATEEKEIPGHGRSYHAQGFGSPVGVLQGTTKCLSETSLEELPSLGLKTGQKSQLKFASGLLVEGTFEKSFFHAGKLLLLSFSDCKVTWGEQTLFEPDWGTYDMAVGSKITSVFGGPTDRVAFGETDDFVATRIPERTFRDEEIFQHTQYLRMRQLREEGLQGERLVDHVRAYIMTHDTHCPDDWLFRIEALELLLSRGPDLELESKIRRDLGAIQNRMPQAASVIADGIALAGRI